VFLYVAPSGFPEAFVSFHLYFHLCFNCISADACLKGLRISDGKLFRQVVKRLILGNVG
jgi:hypothetical protein